MQYPSLSELKRNCSDLLVDESTTVRRAAELFITMNVSQLIVRNCSNQLTGIISENTVIRELMNSGGATLIGAIQSRHVESARESASVDAILPLFRSSCHVILPVVNAQNEVTGVLHRSDIVRVLLSEPSSDSEASQSDVPRPHFRRRRGLHADQQQSPHADDQGLDV